MNVDLQKLAKAGVHRVQSKESHGIRLRDGDLVCFKNDASQLAISSIWRKSAGRVWEWFAKLDPNVLPMNPVRTQVTLAEQLFGFVEQAETTQKGPRIKALGGRLRFSMGRLCSALPINGAYEAEGTTPILAAPKPPSPLHYFHAGGQAVTKS